MTEKSKERSLSVRVLDGAQQMFNNEVAGIFGPNINIPFTNRRMSRFELWIGMPATGAVLGAGLSEVALKTLSYGANLTPENLPLSIAVGLMGAEAGAGTGFTVAAATEVMNGARWFAEKMAKKVPEWGNKIVVGAKIFIN